MQKEAIGAIKRYVLNELDNLNVSSRKGVFLFSEESKLKLTVLFKADYDELYNLEHSLEEEITTTPSVWNLCCCLFGGRTSQRNPQRSSIEMNHHDSFEM